MYSRARTASELSCARIDPLCQRLDAVQIRFNRLQRADDFHHRVSRTDIRTVMHHAGLKPIEHAFARGQVVKPLPGLHQFLWQLCPD